MEEQTLVRMFYENGQVETRPVSWVKFIHSDKVKDVLDGVDLTKLPEVYIAFIDKLIGLQIFSGTFVNVREERQKRTEYRRT